MSKPKFNTVATELLEHAEATHKHYLGFGYKVQIEPFEIHYPARPTFLVRRSPTEHAVLVRGRIDMRELESWVSMAKSMTSDFRVSVCLPHTSASAHLGKQQLALQKLGVGVIVSDGTSITSIAEPVDQGINVTLPDIAKQLKGVQKVLGAAYEHFRAGRWRDCFEEACTALEQEARPYLKKAIRSGRLTVLDAKGKQKNPTAARIDGMTLGQLAVTLKMAHPLNGTDTLLQKALAQINPDRVGAAHKNKHPATEKRLRKNVGMHMHAIINAVRAIKS